MLNILVGENMLGPTFNDAGGGGSIAFSPCSLLFARLSEEGRPCKRRVMSPLMGLDVSGDGRRALLLGLGRKLFGDVAICLAGGSGKLADGSAAENPERDCCLAPEASNPYGRAELVVLGLLKPVNKAMSRCSSRVQSVSLSLSLGIAGTGSSVS